MRNLLKRIFTSPRWIKKFFNPYNLSGYYIFLLNGCNSSEPVKEFDGLSPSYIPPMSTYVYPTQPDPNFNLLQVKEIKPYWVDSLLMENGKELVSQILGENNNTFYYAFPNTLPPYEMPTLKSWRQASVEMELAAGQIFSGLNKAFNVKFIETEDIEGFNVIVISQSFQSNTSGFSYFPNIDYNVGSDLFIAHEFSNPIFISDNATNFDYEVLVHEIGHALGLKHPFAPDRSNTTTLNEFEDNTLYTAMSYNDIQNSFTGSFRSFDLMALAELYGVNPDWNPENNIYKFSPEIGIFILDGFGEDVISAQNALESVFIDLRPGSHCYMGEKSQYISAPYQMTISHGSEIENVISGMGDDIIICNELNNLVITNSGDDRIYAGEGEDVINSGPGSDVINLSETEQSKDTLVIDEFSLSDGVDEVYGFQQGYLGDLINLEPLVLTAKSLLPTIIHDNVPTGFIKNHILRIVDPDLITADKVHQAFHSGANYSEINFLNGGSSLLISSPSTQTGSKQYLFELNKNQGALDVSHLATFNGNYLHISNWSSENFLITSSDLVS